MNNPDAMTIKEPRKKHHCFMAWCITNLVFLVLFIALVFGGSAWAFNTYVSPNIGGVKFGSALKLLAGLRTAKRDQIVTEEYSSADLNEFYFQINSHLFQHINTEEELQEGFADLNAEDRQALVDELLKDASYKGPYEAAADEGKADLLYAYYKEKNKYPVTIAKILDMLPEDTLNGLTNQEAVATATQVAAAEEAENSSQDELKALLEQLQFDFSDKGLLGSFDHTLPEDSEGNLNSVTLRITGKQVAAVIGTVMDLVLSKVELPSAEDGDGIDLSGLNLSDYFGIPQVLISSSVELPENPTQEQLDDYNKNICLGATLELLPRALLENEALVGSVNKTVKEMTGRDNLGNIALNVAKVLLPKSFYLTAYVFPNDPDRQALVKINNYSEALQNDMATIINSITEKAGFTLLEEEGQESTPMMQQVNAKVVEVFTKVQDTVPLTFVQVDGSTAGLQVAHIQMLLQLLNAYDPTGENGISPYMFMTVLECLFSQTDDPGTPSTDFSAFKTQVATKYGLATSFWDNMNQDSFQDLTSQLSVKNLTFADNASMRVDLQDSQLLALLNKAKEDGLLDKLAEENTAAAGESESSSMSDLIKSFSFNDFTIESTNNNRVFAVSCQASLSVADIFSSLAEGEEVLTNALSKYLKYLSLGIKLYFQTDDAGNIVQVGVGEDENSTWRTQYRINAFNEADSDKVIKTITTLIHCIQNAQSEGESGEDELNLNQFSEKIEEVFNNIVDYMADTLYCKIGIKAGAFCLPSLYEIVQGVCQKRIDDDALLTDSDLPSVDSIRNVLTTVYNSNYHPTSYTGTPANTMLANIQSAYYLKEQWTAEQLFDSTSNFTDNISGDSIQFANLYKDTRSLDQLRVNVPQEALADLIKESKMLDSISESSEGDSFIKGLQIVNCEYQLANDDLVLSFIFNASLSEQSNVAAAEESELSWDTLLPDSLYVTASILLHNLHDTYSESAPRYTTSLLINNNSQGTNDLFQVLRVLSGKSFDEQSISDQVRDSVKDVFDKLEQNIQLLYGDTVDKAVRFPSVFDYLVDGVMSSEGYDRTRYMVDVDISTNPDYYTEHPASNPANKTDPEKLMWRLRELGAATAVEDFATSMVAWKDGAPYTPAPGALDAVYYNANTYSAQDETDFYNQMQAFYFLKNQVTSEAFKEGSNIFASLTTNFADSFNFEGITHSFTGVMKNYADAGLYGYTGDRYGAKLSDKAMAGLIKSQTALSFGDSMGTLTITSLTLKVLSDTQLMVEITVEITTKEENAALPGKFYMTTRTLRTVGATENTYQTSMVLNRFAFGSNESANDFTVFRNNLAHIESLDMSSQLNFAEIEASVNNAMRTLFDDKLANYIKKFDNFSNEEVSQGKGVGYIEFNNIYYEILDKLGEISTKDTKTERDAENAENEKNIQQILYKLHHVNAEIATFNLSQGSENFLLTRTDRGYANAVKDYLTTGEEKDYIVDVRGIFFTNTMDNKHYDAWETILKNATTSDKFTAFAASKNYVVTTVKLDLKHSSIGDVSSAVSLLPQYLYATVVIDIAAGGNEVVATTFNDLTKEETDLLQRFMNDSEDKTKVENAIKTYVNGSFSALTMTFQQNTPDEDGEFANYVGKVNITMP